MDESEVRALQEASREVAMVEMRGRDLRCNVDLVAIGEIDNAAIDAYEGWPQDYDFKWERMPKWKTKPAHLTAIDVAVWYDGILAGLCWASPQESQEKVFVLYLQRNPDDTLQTRGSIAPICLSVVRNYALLMGLKYVVIQNPIPEARRVYTEEGFKQVPGLGLAYDLTQDYDALNER